MAFDPLAGLDPLRRIALMPVALMLAVARHYGASVRAPIALHTIYNCALIGAYWPGS